MTTPSTVLLIDATVAAKSALRLYDITVATLRPTADRWDEISRILSEAADALALTSCSADIVSRVRGCAVDAFQRAQSERRRDASKVRRVIAGALMSGSPDETLPMSKRRRASMIDVESVEVRS